MSHTQEKQKASIGVAGMGVMGSNLAANIESRGFNVALWNNTHSKTLAFVENEGLQKNFTVTETEKEFVSSIAKPRIIIMMVTAGKPTDLTIDRFLPLLEEGDILVDGGNSWYEDTIRRQENVQQKGVHFIGMGISGGEEGARLGPSIMPGCTPYAYNAIEPILISIAAKTSSGPCVTHVGPDGAGHFVKMVHNGIEYADMQLIAEAYSLLLNLKKLETRQISKIFSDWNTGPLSSFLMELASKVLLVKDPKTKKPLVEMILDKAGQKGTGKWTLIAALKYASTVPTISAAVDARTISSLKEQRKKAASALPEQKLDFELPDDFAQILQDALLAGKIISYTQGLSLIGAASKELNWNINLKEIARIWKGGCIIRAALLDEIMKAYDKNPTNLLLDAHFCSTINKTLSSLRQIVSFGAMSALPIPAFSGALSYYDSYRSSTLPQNLIQALRDSFGAHTYQRIDDIDGPFIHSDWKI